MAVAQRMYARALLEAADENGRLPHVQEQLRDFVASVRDVPDLRELLRNPQVDPRAKASVLDAVLGEADELVRNFLRLLAERGRVAEIEDVHREFERLVAERQGQIEVELTTAHELSDEDAERIVREIERAVGRRVEARRKVDPEILGGLVLQAGSMRADASVRGRLERLRRDLITR